MLRESPEITLSGRPDRVLMLADVDAHKAQQIAYTAVTIARLHAPKLTGASSSRLEPVYGDGYFGVFFPDPYVWFQDHGISPFTMRSLAGKVIPMWINDPTGAERSKNPKAKTRTTASGVVQVLIFRKAARLGSQITKRKRDPKTGRVVETSKPASYPGAPGRINRREMGAPHTTPGRLGGAIAPGNGGVRWRHPGIAPRLFLNHGVTMAAQQHGILPVRVYVCDSTTNLQRYQ